MDKEQREKALLLSIVSFIQFAGIVKERASNFSIDKVEGSRSFFNELVNNSSYLHGLWSDYFKEQEIFKFSDDLLKYQETAQDIALGMDKSVINHTSHNLNTKLAHLISKVTLKKKASVKVLPYKKFNYESIFPIQENDNKNKAQEYYQKAYNNILQGVSKIIIQAEKDNNLFAVSAALDSLFFENLSNIPAFLGNDIVDISLYEYAKIVAAYTSICFIQAENNILLQPDSFALIRGDFFSIQNFIFNKGVSNKNPAKSLRGKSFYVSLMSDIASLYILEELGLSYFNMMMNAAGQFVIISYNNEDAKSTVSNIKKNIYNWLYERFYCSVSLGLSYLKCSKEDFGKERFNKLILEMLYEKDKSKLSRFNLAERDDFVFKNYHEKFNKDTSLCVYCGMEPATRKVSSDDSIDSCKKCYSYIELGENLTKTDSINIYHDDNGIFNRYSYGYNDNHIKDAFHRMHINLLEKENSGYNCCSVVHYRSYVARNNNGDIRSFDEIVRYGPGAEILAVLKADVDNLGLVFSCGLSKKNEQFDVIDSEITFSKTNMLSRSIHNFFSYFLSDIMDRKKLNVYTVFAGGDDLFIVGKYNDIVKLAKLLNEKFKDFTGDNKEVTISAGIGLFKTGVPIWYMAEETEKLLEQAKHYRADGGSDIYKGNISLLYSVCQYNDFVSWHDDFDNLFNDIESKGIDLSKGFYYKIMEFCDMEAAYKNNNTDINNLMWRPRLYYAVTRLGLESGALKILEVLTDKIEINPNLVKTLIALKLYDLRKIEK